MSLHFLSYPRIRESHSELTPEQARQIGQAEWIATEKIHGANFCILSDGEHVECAKRKAKLGATESFFGYRDVIAPMFSTILELHAEVRAWSREHWQRDILHMALYGELYGGGYDHPDVSVVEGVQRVQTGIDYAPDINLCGFDIAVQLADQATGFDFLDFDDAHALATAREIPWVEPLARGRLTDLLEMNTDFDSTIPERHNLPALPPGTNLAEGVVLRPARELNWAPEQRPLIKLKSPRFAEDARYHQATNWSAARAHLEPGAQALDTLEWAATSRLTPPRVQAAMSKIGRPQGADDPLCAEIVEEVLADIFDDLRATHARDLLAISHEDLALLRASLAEDARALVLEL